MLHTLSLIQIAGVNGPTYELYFKEVDPNDTGAVSASVAAAFLKRSGLSDNLLSRIWELADWEKKGCLNKQGFFVAIKLIALVQAGKEPLIGNLTLPVAAPKITPLESRSRTSSIQSQGKGSSAGEFQALFESLIPENGKLSGLKMKPVLMNSGLPTATLVKIWDMGDADKDGFLTFSEFTTVMQLVKSAKESPAAGPATASYTQLFHQLDRDGDGFVSGSDVRELFLSTGLEPQVLAGIWDRADTERCGRLGLEQFTQAWTYIQQQCSSPPAVRQLEEVKAKRSLCEQRCSELSTQLHVREAELQMAQREELQLTTTRDQLQAQRKEALSKVQEVEERDAKLAGSLAELEARMKEETAAVASARARLDSEQAGMRAVVQETLKLRKELTALTREEASHVDALAQSKTRLDRLQRELDTETRAAEVEESRLWGLREALQKLQNGEDLADMISDHKSESSDVISQQQQNSIDFLSEPFTATNITEKQFTTDNSNKNESLSFLDFQKPRSDSHKSGGTGKDAFTFLDFQKPTADPLSSNNNWFSNNDVFPAAEKDPFGDPFGGSNFEPPAQPSNASTGFSADFGDDPFASAHPFADEDPFKEDPFAQTDAGAFGSLSASKLNGDFGKQAFGDDSFWPVPSQSSTSQAEKSKGDDPFWSVSASASAVSKPAPSASAKSKSDEFFVENPHDLTEGEQLAWATQESARLAEEMRREEEEFKRALSLSELEK